MVRTNWPFSEVRLPKRGIEGRDQTRYHERLQSSAIFVSERMPIAQQDVTPTRGIHRYTNSVVDPFSVRGFSDTTAARETGVEGIAHTVK